MQDRVPLYPGRVKMTPVAGQANTYDMVRADDPTQAGTPLNKATLLKDATAALYGLGTGAVPDDVLAELGRFQSGLGNEYIWEKKLSTVQKTYDLGTENPLYMCAYKWNGSQSTVMTVTYADDIDISPGNVASLKAPIYTVDVTWNDYSAANVLKGKFFLAALDTGNITENIIVKGSENGEASKRVTTNAYIGVYFPAKPVENVQYTVIDQITYVNSPNANAYPPAVPDGYTYTPLGQLGKQVRIETGSYAGAGTYGKANPNTLTFGFAPKLVIIYERYQSIAGQTVSANSTDTAVVFTYNAVIRFNASSNGRGAGIVVTVSDKTLQWYSTISSMAQLNSQENYYIAIG